MNITSKIKACWGEFSILQLVQGAHSPVQVKEMNKPQGESLNIQ